MSVRWRLPGVPATKNDFTRTPTGPKQVLMRMPDRGILESDSQGRYRIKPVSRKDKNKHWVAPDIDKILQESGVEVESGEGLAPDEHYEQL